MKRFYNNTKMSGAFGKALRMLALLCVLLGFSSSAWGAYYLEGELPGLNGWDKTTPMTKSSDKVYTYTFKGAGNGDKYFKIYTEPKDNWGQDRDKFIMGNGGDTQNANTIKVGDSYNYTKGSKSQNIIKITLGTTYTITVTDNGNDKATVTLSEKCRPKSTLISATYNVASKKIVLSGSLTETCGTKTYYGFRYRIKDETTWNAQNIAGIYPDVNLHHSTTSIDNYTVNWDGFEAGKTYEFCAYAYQGSTYYNSSEIKTVTTPVAPTEVLLTKDAVYNEDTKTANLYGYLKQNPVQNGNQCAFIVEYGFVLEQGITAKPKVGNQNTFKVISPNGENTENLIHGETFEATSNELADGQVYAYRAYVYYGGTYIYSNEIRYLSTGGCIPQPGGNGTIYITVDGSRSPADDDDCALIYSSLQTALDKLKENELYTADGNLLQAVVITVSQFDNAAGAVGRGTYVGNKEYYVSGGNKDGVDGQSYARKLRVLAIDGFNKNKEESTYDPEHTLTIQANNGDKPRVEHMLIRKSRNVKLKGLSIFSREDNNGDTKDTALEIDEGRFNNWQDAYCDFFDANIVVEECIIGSNGFTGVHVNSYSGLTFKYCTFNLSVEDFSDNARDYGASAKFFECRNIKFIQNNFWGGHSTLLWLQQTKNALFYNNVFWNTNEYSGSCQAVRVYNQSYSGKTQCDSIAVIYNTFYLADNEKNSGSYSFIYFGGVKENYDVNGDVYFKYNNCYSYDADMKTQRSNPADLYKATKNNLCPNNYWSVYDGEHTTSGKSVFDPGFGDCGKTYINVADLVCTTGASGPASLIIKQPINGQGKEEAGLKVGPKLTIDDIKGFSNITLDQVELYSDRYNQGERSSETNGKWTLGALEASTGNIVNTIYWLGGDSKEWDNRNNWAYIPGETEQTRQEGRAITHRILSCVDVLDENLKIVIPEKGSAKYPTTTKATYFYPEIPSQFAANSDARKNIVEGEQVSAGVGTGNRIVKYASSINLEYGAALKGVHYLKESNDTYRYDEGITNMTLERDQWTLVGPVVLPWDDKDKNTTRDVMSNDYFLNYEPNVYMRRAVVGGSATEPSLTWNQTFAELDSLCKPNTAFAVTIPNSYGNYWGIGLSAQDYYGSICGLTGDALNEKLADVTVPKSFNPFVGRFVNEKELIKYSDLPINQPVLLNNSYPCNIDVQALEGTGNENGIVYLYDYIAKSIKVAGDDSWTAEGSYKGYNGVNTQYIKPQNGFVFIPKKSSVEVTEAMLVGGDTKSRSAEIENNKVSINLHAGSSNSLVHSSISIEHDPELGTNVESAINAPKVFAYREAPELYMMAHDKTLCRLAVPKSETVIPLGIQVKTPMYVTFKVARNSGYSKVTLVDTENNYEHDLLESPYTADILPKGTCEGRYFLNVVSDASDFGDDDVTTSVEDASGEDLAINIYNDTDNSDAITVVTSNVELEKIYVSDSMGRVIPFEANGNYAKIQIPNAMGVYIIQVIGDKASRTEKVILK